MLGVGILGATGYIGTPYRAELREAAEEKDIRIVALCARRRDLLESAGAEDGARLLTDRWREVVEHPEVNVVLVATPDALHYEPVLACAALRKHVICEKPLGVDARQAWQMWSACRAAGVRHFVPFWTRYVPLFARAREVVESGRLGPIRAVVYRWHNPRPPAMPFTWRDDAQLSAAGSVADVGSHAYDTLRWTLGCAAQRVLAHADVISAAKPDLGAINLDEALQWGEGHQAADSGRRRKGTAYDYASVSFVLDSGAVGTLVLSHAPYLRKGLAAELELHGEAGSLAVDRLGGRLIHAQADGATETEAVADPGWGNRFLKHVIPALQGVSAGHPDLEDGYHVQLFTDAVVQSARQGGWVDLGELQRRVEE